MHGFRGFGVLGLVWGSGLGVQWEPEVDSFEPLLGMPRAQRLQKPLVKEYTLKSY